MSPFASTKRTVNEEQQKRMNRQKETRFFSFRSLLSTREMDSGIRGLIHYRGMINLAQYASAILIVKTLRFHRFV